MTFSSLEFMYFFLLPCMLGFMLLRWCAGRHFEIAAIYYLSLASAIFLAWWSVSYLLVLVISLGFNYLIGLYIARNPSRILLMIGIGFNLAYLGVFKYYDFFVGNLNVLGAELAARNIELPLAISFYTFTQIAYLVEVWRARGGAVDLPRYLLFVLFFPHLIAGPIVLHGRIVPQFTEHVFRSPMTRNLAIGSAIFIVGLFKKVVLADSAAIHAGAMFAAAESGIVLGALHAWLGALCYTLQIYFDFSGYSDMAVGLSLLFGIRLPLNFLSPYKATSIIDFWRRWYISLSVFLRDYLYIPLGGNRHGSWRRYGNLLITMVLGGLWHGASWNFVIWGGLHGLYLLINHAWNGLRIHPQSVATHWRRLLGGSLTFLAVVVAWVFFRAETLNGALGMLKGMAGLNGLGTMSDSFPAAIMSRGYSPDEALLLTLLLLGICWWLPSSMMFFRRQSPVTDGAMLRRESAYARGLGLLAWRPSAIALNAVLILMGVYAVLLMYNGARMSEFIYFRF